MKRMVIWKDDVMPRYVNRTDQLANSSGADAAANSSKSTLGDTSTPSSGGTVTVSTIAAIATNCITFVLICVIIWLLLRYGRRRQSAGLTTKEVTDANIRKTESDRQPGPNSFVPAVYHQNTGASCQTGVWTIPPSILDSQRATRTLPMAPSRATESSYIPGISHQDMAREVLAEQQQEIGPHSPSTFRDTEDSQSVDEERVNRVILEVARRMGGVERTGLPPDYADLQ